MTQEDAARGVVAKGTYAGVFAWRRGHMPVDGKPTRLSGSAIEYAAAGARAGHRPDAHVRAASRSPCVRPAAPYEMVNGQGPEPS